MGDHSNIKEGVVTLVAASCWPDLLTTMSNFLAFAPNRIWWYQQGYRMGGRGLESNVTGDKRNHNIAKGDLRVFPDT
jgi:hypothetical protein